jgi:hypothetical protein
MNIKLRCNNAEVEIKEMGYESVESSHLIRYITMADGNKRSVNKNVEFIS